MSQSNIAHLREENTASRICRTGDNSGVFRTAGIDLGKVDFDAYAAANLELQPLDASEWIPSGSTTRNPLDQMIVRAGFEAHPRILEMVPA
jgi:hypothetical protein